MRAATVDHSGGDGSLVVVDRPAPRAPRGDELLLDVEATSVNGSDLGLLRARLPLASLPLGPRPGFDVVGRVRAVGPAVTSTEVGERVAALLPHTGGGMAEQVLVRQGRTCAVPDDADPVAVVAVVLAGLTALQGLYGLAGLPGRPGARVLVVGASGGIGHLGVQLAALAGAAVTGTARGAKADRLREVVPGTTVLGASVEELAGSQERWDVVLDTPGAVDPRQADDLLLDGGVLVSTRPVDPRLALGVAAAALGRGPRTTAVRTAARPGDLARLVRLVGDGRLQPALDTVLPLEQAGAAANRARTDAVGKVVLTL